MERTARPARLGALCLLAAVALANGGCLIVAAGAAAGGAVGYAYYKANVTRMYAANRTDVEAAARASLQELGMPVVKEERDGDDVYLESRTADGDKVRIRVEQRPSRIPAEGPLTEIGVRVATFGDEAVSERVLDQIGYHLVPNGPALVQPGPTPATLGNPIQPASAVQVVPGPAPPQTAPPPLLPAEPVKIP